MRVAQLSLSLSIFDNENQAIRWNLAVDEIAGFGPLIALCKVQLQHDLWLKHKEKS